VVALSVANEIPLNRVPLAELQKFSPLFDSDVATIFGVCRSLAQRQAIGAPSPENITEQINRCAWIWVGRLTSIAHGWFR
jgi:argininosuccinate lyase